MSVFERTDKTGTIEEPTLNLSESENKALQDIKEKIAKVGDDILSDLRDGTLVRFLRHQSFDADAALVQLQAYLKWRRENNIDDILKSDNVDARKTLRKIIPYAYHNCDNDGRPIYIEKTGKINVTALIDNSILDAEDFLQSHIWGLEFLQQTMQDNSLRLKKRVDGLCTILDMEGLGFHHRSAIYILKKCMDFDNSYFPEYLGRLYVINTPFIAPMLYQVVQPFLNEVVKSRIQIVSGDPKAFLPTVIPAENLPVEYGGTCTGDACNYGGLRAIIGDQTQCIHVFAENECKHETHEGLETQKVDYDFEKVVATPLNEEGDFQFSWYFEVEDGYDIEFSIEVLPAHGNILDKDKKHYIKHPQRVTGSRGSHKAAAGTRLLFRFDNNFSYFTSKSIKYIVTVSKFDRFENQMAIKEQSTVMKA